jgi:hypothetical protein
MQLAVKAVSKGSTETFGSFQNFSSIVVYGVFFYKAWGFSGNEFGAKRGLLFISMHRSMFLNLFR